jgi:predicted RNase H-like HicB family nuclease
MKCTTIIIKEGKWYVSRCVELGVVSQGKTVEESQKNLKEAVELYLEDAPKAEKLFLKESPFISFLDIKHA